jgi:hypothetical protein
LGEENWKLARKIKNAFGYLIISEGMLSDLIDI